jgi:hypothetical protein
VTQTSSYFCTLCGGPGDGQQVNIIYTDGAEISTIRYALIDDDGGKYFYVFPSEDDFIERVMYLNRSMVMSPDQVKKAKIDLEIRSKKTVNRDIFDLGPAEVYTRFSPEDYKHKANVESATNPIVGTFQGKKITRREMEALSANYSKAHGWSTSSY